MEKHQVDKIFYFKKKWYFIFLGGVVNSIFFSLFYSLFCHYSTSLIYLIIPFAFLIIFLVADKYSLFFTSTLTAVATFIFIGFPLSNYIYMQIFENRYPGEEPWAGDGFGMLVATGSYIIMSIIAWCVAFILTAYYNEYNKKSKHTE